MWVLFRVGEVALAIGLILTVITLVSKESDRTQIFRIATFMCYLTAGVFMLISQLLS
ncbi:hypothetical protein BTIS_1027 [Bifidobacterium tissieri]|uniref:Uncharacterized protein n=1 Tax=Bifidobacterium tissieri TaxID=1630162 RepID=A0A261FFW4_9BIFI|nr:hypothetical protein BTIS_1027 [Bifidobacterium tissieri]